MEHAEGVPGWRGVGAAFRPRRLHLTAAAVLTGAAAAVLVAFIGLPLLAIFLRVPLSMLLEQLRSPVARDALRIS
ncbi:MAG: hypothetical protein WCN81_14415, partial [Actinomycetes bacterium]